MLWDVLSIRLPVADRNSCGVESQGRRRIVLQLTIDFRWRWMNNRERLVGKPRDVLERFELLCFFNIELKKSGT